MRTFNFNENKKSYPYRARRDTLRRFQAACDWYTVASNEDEASKMASFLKSQGVENIRKGLCFRTPNPFAEKDGHVLGRSYGSFDWSEGAVYGDVKAAMIASLRDEA